MKSVSASNDHFDTGAINHICQIMWLAVIYIIYPDRSLFFLPIPIYRYRQSLPSPIPRNIRIRFIGKTQTKTQKQFDIFIEKHHDTH